MKNEIKKDMIFVPHPVLMIGTYDENGKANVMNAAWGMRSDYKQVKISLSKHKTTDNFQKTGAFTVAFATKETAIISDYFGIKSGYNEDKIAKTNVTVSKAPHVNAPIIEEYPITLECEVESFNEDDGILTGNVVGVLVDDSILDEKGKIDPSKIHFICYDEISSTYRELGEEVGKAFNIGLNIK